MISAALAAFAGCTKGLAETEEIGPEEEMTLNFCVEDYDPLETKANAVGVTDDEVDRLDVFCYGTDGYTHGHYVFGGEGEVIDLSEISLTIRGRKNDTHRFLIMANLDEDSANYIRFLDRVDMHRYPEGFIPWSAGNCRINRPLMAGTARVVFGSQTTAVTVRLWRYAAKFEIGTVTAEFEEAADRCRNVYLKHIVFSNAWDLIRICQTNAGNFLGNDPCDLFGNPNVVPGAFGSPSGYIYWKANLFMDQYDWTTYGLTYAVMDGSYTQSTWGGRGKLALSYNYLYNNNYMQAANSINLSCPESLRDVSQHTWNVAAGEGQLCNAAGTMNGVLTVNKVFYTLPTFFSVYYTAPGVNADAQDRGLKLVLAVTINGTLYFYHTHLKYILPNKVYRINNITLKGEPSEYPNVWVQGGVVTKNAAVEVHEPEWREHGNVMETDNLVMGL